LGKYLKFLIPAALGIVIILFFGRSLNWAEVWQSLQKANALMLTLSVLIICLGYLLRSLRWRTLLAPITESSLRELFATTTVGFAAVFLFGRTGEVVRPLWLPMRDSRVRPSAALATIGIERICDLLAIILLFALNLLWFQAPGGREAEYLTINRIGLWLLAAAIGGVISLVIFQRFSSFIIEKIEQILSKSFVPKRFWQIFINLLNYLATSLQILRNPKELALTLFWTATLWFSISLPTWFTISAFGFPISFSESLFVMGWATVASLVPTPGGAAGAFHATTAAALMWVNINREDAVAAAIVLHLVYFAPALIFGFYYFIHGDVTWARLRSLIIAEKEPLTDSPDQLQPQKLIIDKTEFREARLN
jgi:uncharacterized protein (TIRG00374 family)